MSFIELVPPIYYNVKQYGAAGDGVSDDTIPIADARSAANAAGGGAVFYPPGTYISGNQTLYAKVHDIGSGIDTTTIKLKNGSNSDLFSGQVSSINIGGSFGVGPIGNLFNFSIRDMTLDGNKANQSSGPSYPLRFYAYGYILQNLVVKNGYSGGMLVDWNAGSDSPGNDSMEAQFINLKVHDSGGIGVQMGGPHDSQILNLVSFLHASHCLHVGPNMNGQFTSCHFWGPALGVRALAVLCEGTSTTLFVNCEAESSDTVQVAIVGFGGSWIGGHIFAFAGVSTTTGIQIGQQAGNTPYPGQIYHAFGLTTAQAIQNLVVNTWISSCEGPNGAIWFANDGGNNSIQAVINQVHGKYITGSVAPTTAIRTICNGLTPDGTPATGSYNLFSGRSNNLFRITNTTTDVFNVNTFASTPQVATVANAELRGYSDFYSTLIYRINPDGKGSARFSGSLSVGQSATAPDPGNNGTISTASIGESRINPASNITGVVLQPGTVPGQEVTVVNESSFTVAFDVARISNVADGTLAVIAANRKMHFTWDSSVSQWYH